MPGSEANNIDSLWRKAVLISVVHRLYVVAFESMVEIIREVNCRKRALM